MLDDLSPAPHAPSPASQGRDPLLFEQVPVAFLLLDPAGTIRDANRRAGADLGLPCARLRGRPLAAFTPPEQASTVRVLLRQVFSQAGPARAELPLLRPDGTTFHAGVEAEADGDVCRLVFTDLSAARAAHEELLRVQHTLERQVERHAAEVQEVTQELEGFVTAVMQELDGPLRHIRAFAKPLHGQAEMTAEERAQAAGRVLDATDWLEMRLRALSLFSNASRQRLKFVAVDLNRVLPVVVKKLAPDLAARSVQLTHDVLPIVRGDMGALQMVFTQLLTNALKATRTRDAARIHVGIRPLERGVAVFVEDNGIGFNMRYRDRLFTPFGRLHREEDFGGPGLGLALVRRLVSRQGGQVWAEGRPGQGATFWLALPHHAEEP
ncbi:PAS domain S-box-containing protein [Deinococcus sp. HSC-46F16]|uniref:sensor histidine kinase n=1 Tax=Deinococcus sp. HSC-46F16 TaxID=2910968 RepID=UPI0020A0F784|nr:ATP-binding protein [Deinococcus sp. HSC-46F16]MCP2014692.1 PAS domain S-box-containing protein [Deinococcus sp. HSC-46F16]